MPVTLSQEIQDEVFEKVRNAFYDFPLFEQLVGSQLRKAIADANTIDIDVKSTRKLTEKYFDVESFKSDQQKLILTQIQLILRTCYIVILSYHENVRALLWNDIPTMLLHYPQFQGQDEQELQYLLIFRNMLRISLIIIPARLNKQLLLKVASRLEGSRNEYITGGGQKPCVTRRVEIYEQEGNIRPERRQDRIRPPRIIGKKRTHTQSMKDLKVLRLASDEIRQLTKGPIEGGTPLHHHHNHHNKLHNPGMGPNNSVSNYNPLLGSENPILPIYDPSLPLSFPDDNIVAESMDDLYAFFTPTPGTGGAMGIPHAGNNSTGVPLPLGHNYFPPLPPVSTTNTIGNTAAAIPINATYYDPKSINTTLPNTPSYDAYFYPDPLNYFNAVNGGTTTGPSINPNTNMNPNMNTNMNPNMHINSSASVPTNAVTYIPGVASRSARTDNTTTSLTSNGTVTHPITFQPPIFERTQSYSESFPPVLSREQSELIDRLLPDGDFWKYNALSFPTSTTATTTNDFAVSTTGVPNTNATGAQSTTMPHPLHYLRGISWDIYNGTFSDDLRNVFGPTW